MRKSRRTQKALLALGALLAATSAAQATCVTPLSGLDSAGTARTFFTVLDGSTNCIGTSVIVDGTAGANKTAVKPASTAAAAADPALVVSISPNSPLPAFAANPTVILGTGGNVVGAVTQSGNWTARIVGNAGAIFDFAGQAVASPANSIQVGAQFNTTPTTLASGQSSPLQMDNAGNLLVNVKAGGTGSNASVSTTGTAVPGSATYIGGNGATGNLTAPIVRAGNTAGASDVAMVVSDPNVLAAVQAPIPTGTNTIGGVTNFSGISSATVTRAANTTTYTVNTGWCNLTAACATVFTFTNICRANTTQVLIPEIDIWSSANPTTKLQGILWLFTTTPGTIINDNATFNIAAADFANLTGNQQGFAFTLASAQASGAANSGVSLTGTTYHAACGSGTTTMIGMVQVVNAYVPANAEVLHITIHAVGVN